MRLNQNSEGSATVGLRENAATWERLECRLENFSTPPNHGLLANLPARSVTYRKDQPVWVVQGESPCCFIVREGWALDFTILPRGQRYIGDFYGPGAICNWSRLADPNFRTNVLFKGGTVVSVVEADDLKTVLGRTPSLDRAVMLHEMIRTRRKSWRTSILIALPAIDRIQAVLLDLRDEFMASGERDEWIPLPLTQLELADMTGLSQIHVNRILKELEATGDLIRNDRKFRIPHIGKWCDHQGYRGFYTPIAWPDRPSRRDSAISAASGADAQSG